MLAAFLLLAGTSAWADCACFCVNGELTTMCTEAGEAQDSPDLCPASSVASCPQEAEGAASASYEAPSDAAVDCRNVRVFDAVRGEYVTAKACNVL